VSDQDVDRRYEQFIAQLTPELRADWVRCVLLFDEKFGAELAAELAAEGTSSPLEPVEPEP
jgi:hypothetical protein